MSFCKVRLTRLGGHLEFSGLRDFHLGRLIDIRDWNHRADCSRLIEKFEIRKETIIIRNKSRLRDDVKKSGSSG